VVVGECGDGAAALSALTALAPDLVFLDVRMPGLDGLRVLDALGAKRAPEVIFVTAYDRYAIPAFERHALDYLLKPVSQERFRESVRHARDRLRRRPADGRPTQLLVRQRGRSSFVRLSDVEWIEAQGNRVRLHATGVVHGMRGPLTALAARLAGARFRRISRSALVNLDRVREIRSGLRGDGVVVLHSGLHLRLSRRFRQGVLGSPA
ncbi:MAG: LytR/AlgR family response regulator transcription factor, partial [Acidimicrobiales bacterium]